MIHEKFKNLFEHEDTRAWTDLDVALHPQAVRLVLVLLDLSRDLSHFPPLAEVDQVFAVSAQKVWVSLFGLQDVGQVDSCHTSTEVRDVLRALVAFVRSGPYQRRERRGG